MGQLRYKKARIQVTARRFESGTQVNPLGYVLEHTLGFCALAFARLGSAWLGTRPACVWLSLELQAGIKGSGLGTTISAYWANVAPRFLEHWDHTS
ncbi:hypothetical protein D8674_030077 [Pyrus ussuriensis x Pyrus communis]|uniref:Uncharacterized protein n=1 Tax=Pyrus ussuriensis x Pyrus communis TaxID=2448454 RepID=A0A5N5EV27_9ROSA|nr:hypothetical protein D8674_030077 [Pyrus ussuriensis x Pyrus communis]